MTVTEEELQRIVAAAVKVALKEIKGEEAAQEPLQPAEPVQVSQFGEAELDDAMRLMQSNRGKGDEPMVGIFWYSPQMGDLFGIRSHRISDYTKANSRSEFDSISCSEMHEDVWKKEFHRQKYKSLRDGPSRPHLLQSRYRGVYNRCWLMDRAVSAGCSTHRRRIQSWRYYLCCQDCPPLGHRAEVELDQETL